MAWGIYEIVEEQHRTLLIERLAHVAKDEAEARKWVRDKAQPHVLREIVGVNESPSHGNKPA